MSQDPRGRDDQPTRRRMLKATLATAGTVGLSLAPIRRLRAQATTRQGLALCIGLNEVNPAAYAGWTGSLAGCIADSEAMEKIARDRRFRKVIRLNNREATIQNVRRHIAWAADELRSGDIVLISCSSHGGFRTDADGDEDDGKDETWCMYDGQWGDDDRHELWKRFKPGVRLLVIGDMCHSGTSAKAMQAYDGLKHAKELRKERERHREFVPRSGKSNIQRRRDLLEKDRSEITTRVHDELADRLKEFAQFLQQGRREKGDAPNDNIGARFNLSDGRPSPIRAMPEELAIFLSENQPARKPVESNSRASNEMEASGMLLAACQDWQTALDGANNGVFTDALSRTWNDGQFEGNYDAFFKAIQLRLEHLPAHQPNRDFFGRTETQFNKERPFQVT